MKDKYNLPKTREEKIKALKGLLTGQLNINSLRVPEVFVCTYDTEDSDYINIKSMTDRSTERISLSEYERRKGIPNNDVYVIYRLVTDSDQKGTIYED